MYGYIVLGITVTPNNAFGSPAQIDSLNGATLDFADEWRRYFGARPNGTDLRTRRYWDSEPTKRHLEPGSPHRWSRLYVRYGPTGIPGDVVDTTVGTSTAAVGVDDATTHNYRHLLLRPTGGRVAMLAAEVIGRGRAASRIIDAFRKDFEQAHPQYNVEYETLADGEYWDSFLENADFIAMNVTRHRPVAGYFDADGDGAETIVEVKSTIQAAGRGARLRRGWLRPLLSRDVTVQDVFGLDFEPERASVVLESEGQRKTIVLDAGEDPAFVYPLGDDDRRDRPSNTEFFEAAVATMTRLLASYPSQGG